MNLYAYVLLGYDDEIIGVYSSVKSAYRDGLKQVNVTNMPVHYIHEGRLKKVSLSEVRTYFKDRSKGVLRLTSGRRTVVKIMKCPFLS